jgi:nitroreductase
MDFQDVVRKRRMVRAFDDRPLPREAVERILANAQRGPSAGFTQGFEFLVFDGHEQTGCFWRQLEEESDGSPFLTGVRAAPLVIVPVAHPRGYVRRYLEPDKVEIGRTGEADWPAPHWYTDTAFASLLIILTAVDEGLGTFYFSVGAHARDIPPFKAAFGIPEEYEPMGAIAIGYPAPDVPSPSLKRGRKPRERVMHFGSW